MFLKGDATGCVDGVVNVFNGSITIEIEVEVGFKARAAPELDQPSPGRR